MFESNFKSELQEHLYFIELCLIYKECNKINLNENFFHITQSSQDKKMIIKIKKIN